VRVVDGRLPGFGFYFVMLRFLYLSLFSWA
jgi:hypothetical protein